MDHNATVDRCAPSICIHNTDRRVRLAINLRVRFDLFCALPEDRVFQKIDIGFLAGSRVPFKLFSVSVCVRISSLVSAFDTGLLDKLLGFIDADSPGFGSVFGLCGVGCSATDGFLGGLNVVHFNW